VNLDEPPPFESVVTDEAELRRLYRPPARSTATKKMSRIDPWVRVFIEAAPFAFIATAGKASPVTVSPRGGDAGFVRLLDDRRLVLGDYAGNNLLDSIRNIVSAPAVGLLFVIPGRPETIRIDGDAWVTTDPDLLALTAQPRRRPKAAIGVLAREVFFHCPSSFQRADLWNPATWRADSDLEFDDFIRSALDPADLPEWARP
jgi:PPOX class probable FMN-dependent enzyme